MKRFKNLLAVVPEDHEQAKKLMASAADLAERNDADLTVFSVIEPIPKRRRFLTQNSRTVDLESLLISARIDELKEAMPPSDKAARFEVVSGVRYIEIIDKVGRDGHDLVLTTPDQDQQRRGLRVSSTTMHLLRKCPVPVWVHSPNEHDPAVIAVAVGPLDEGEPTDGLNVKLLELGASLAATRGAELHVIHAWRLEGETMLRSPRLSYPTDRIEGMATEVRDEASFALQELLAKTGVSQNATTHLRKGHAGDVINEVVAEIDPAIVVMGTVARTGVPGMIIGNTAERVLSSLDTSIMAVKPYGFVSPVEALRGWEPQQLPY